MPIKERWKVDIPDGFRIMEREFPIAGVHHYKDNFFKVVTKGKVAFFLERENNKFDANAIAVTASRRGLFGIKKVKIGYIPAEIASQIADAKVYSELLLRPKAMYVGDDGYIDLKVDLLIKKEFFKKYQNI